MEVWDPKDKTTVLSQIKWLISRSYRGLKTFRYLLYPGVLFILLFLLFGLLPGCASTKWPWQKEEVTAQPNPLVIPPDGLTNSQNTIACIKLQPECKFDQEN